MQDLIKITNKEYKGKSGLIKDKDFNHKIFEQIVSFTHGGIERLYELRVNRKPGQEKTPCIADAMKAIEEIDFDLNFAKNVSRYFHRDGNFNYHYNRYCQELKQGKVLEPPPVKEDEPPTNNDFSGLEPLLKNVYGVDSTTADDIAKLGVAGAKKVKTPDGWEVEF